MTKLVLTSSRYRLPTEDGKPGPLVFEGDEFETTPENAERLVKAGAAEEAKSRAKADDEDKTEGPPADPTSTDPAGKSKPAPRGAK